MRIKKFAKLLALVLCISAFSLPVTAYANSDMTPPTLTATLEGETLVIESWDDSSGVEAVYINGTPVTSLVDGKASVSVKEYAETLEVYAVDYAGNQSDTVTLDNPHRETDNAAIEDETDQGTAFTPDGTGTVLDNVTDAESNKQFYTITTEAGNIFYLIIDGEREDNNVYFLNAVTEADLMALAESDSDNTNTAAIVETCTCTDKCEAGAVNTSCTVCKNDLTRCVGKAAQAEESEGAKEPEQPKTSTGSIGTIIFIIIGVLLFGGAAYYVKIVRPKQQAADDEDEDMEDEGYGEGFDPDEILDLDKYYLDDEDGSDTGDSE